jgi:hypothetical protein
MASIDGLQNNALIVNTLDGLTTITTAGGVVDPSLYVPYTSATANVDLGSFNLSGNSISGTTLTGTTVNGTTVNSTDIVTNTLAIKNSGIAANKFLLDYNEAKNNLDINFVTATTNDKIFSIDQYGNVFLPQGIYFEGNSDHYIGNTGTSNIVFSIQSAYKYQYLTNNIERAFINSSGFWTDNGVNLKDSATGFYWTFQTSSSTRLGVNYNGGLIAYFDSSTGFNSGQINFTTSLNSISPTVFGYLSGCTSNIQAQISAISTASYITKTGTNTLVNTILQLSSGGSFNVYSPTITGNVLTVTESTGLTTIYKLNVSNVSTFSNTATFNSTAIFYDTVNILGGSFIVNNGTLDTYISNLKSTSLINSVSASYYDPSSSIQTQLNNRLTKTGTNTDVNCIFRLANSGNLVINNVTSDPIFQCINNTRNVYIFNLLSTSQINSVSAGFFDFTSSGQTQLNNRITTTGTTTGIDNVLQLASSGSFAINSSSSVSKVIIGSENNFYLNGVSQARFIVSPTSNLYGCFIRNDGNTTFIMLTNVNDVNGSWNGLRPFYIENSTGKIFSLNSQYFRGGIDTEQIAYNVDDQLIIRTGTSDSSPAGSYITLRTSSSSLGVNFVNWNNTTNWASFRSGGFDCNVPARLNNTTNNINAQKISGYNNYVLCQDSVNGTVKVADSQVISLFANSANWGTGYTFSSIFTKYTDGSVCSIVGTNSFFCGAGGGTVVRIRFTNVSTGTNYDISNANFLNATSSHLPIGISGQPTLPNGVYNVTFTIISGVGVTDTNDYIRCIVILSPS